MQAKLTAAILLLGAAFLGGWQTNQWRMSAKIALMEQNASAAMTTYVRKVRETETALRAKSDELDKQQAQLIETEKKHQLAIQRAVSDYQHKHRVTTHADTCDRLDNDWVRIHNVAASAVPHDASTPSRPATATTAAALDTVTTNYGIAQSCERRLRGWQEWWERVGQK